MRAVVLWRRRKFSADCEEIDAEWSQEADNDTYKVQEVENTTEHQLKDVLSTVDTQKLHLRDNTTLGKKLKHHSVYNSGSYVLLTPPGMEISDKVLLPVLKNLHDHIAIMRGESAVLLKPTAHFDLKIDDQCYIIIPPNLVDRYADNAPEPLHLMYYVLAIVATVTILAVIFHRTRKRREDSNRISFLSF